MIKLRPYQQELPGKIYEAWDNGKRNPLLVMATGLGKTKTYSAIAIDQAYNYGRPTVIIAHRRELVQQNSITLAEVGVEHNIIAPQNVVNGIIGAHRKLFKKSFYHHAAPITVISVDTLVARNMRYGKWAEQIQVKITDEAAHVLRDNKWGKALMMFPRAFGLGVTATPKRLDKRGLGVHADGVFDTMIMGPSCHWGIENGYLAPYQVAMPKSVYNFHLKEAKEGHDYTREALAVAANASAIHGDVVRTYLDLCHGKQNIVFASDMISAKKTEDEFKKNGVNAKLLTAETDDRQRIQSLIDFKEGKIKVLINIDLFDEGLDVPGIETVSQARKTASTSKFLQMCGRALRPVYAVGYDLSTVEGRKAAIAASGKPYALIIDHVMNIGTPEVPGHGLPDSRRTWTLDRGARRGEKLNLVQICKNVECNRPFDRILTECPFCDYAVPKPKPGEGSRVTPDQVDGDIVLVDLEVLREMEAKTQLEHPTSVARRVEKAVGPAAAQRALNNQVERMATQKALVDEIALWAGKMKSWGYADRGIHKHFYIKFGKTITEALAEPRAEMESLIEELKNENYRPS